jgi:hypothetical protein
MINNQLMDYLNYSDNILIQACGPIHTDSDLIAQLTYIPQPFPSNMDFHNHSALASHYVEKVKSIHVPSSESLSIAQAIDLMLRQGYVDRNPSSSLTWQGIYEKRTLAPPKITAQAAYVTGISGTGKSRAVERALQLYQQVVVHDSFPQMRSQFKQLVWLKVDVPPNGSSRELAFALMRATDHALGTSLFEDYALSSKRSGLELLNLWWDKARVHFLGLLVLDEVSNLFKIETLKQRLKRKNESERLHLRVADDEALKFIINLNNSAKIPLVMMGTPDGMEAFCTRLSTAERLITGGIYKVNRSTNEENSHFRKYMFPALDKFRLGHRVNEDTPRIRGRLIELSAGIPRIYVSLWCLSGKVMVQRNGKTLEVEDLDYVMDKFMSPLKPAINALQTDDPRRLARYEDLLPPSEFWSGLFNG